MKFKYNVSIIVPCYQVEKYIEESVLSMKNQKFTNYEIILVDDGTKDNTISVAEKALEGFENLKIIHKENGGLPSARNEGLKVAEGKYVCFLDSDDIVNPNHLLTLYNLCEDKKLKAAFSLFEYTTESNRQGTMEDAAGNEVIIKREKLLWGFMDRKYEIHCCSLLISYEYLQQMNFCFNDKLKYGEDIEFLWRLFPSIESIGCTNCHTYKYMIRGNSIMTTQTVERVIIAYSEFIKAIDNNKTKYPEDKRIWNFLPLRVYLTFSHSFAMSSSYECFRTFTNKMEPKGLYSLAINYPHAKVKILAIIYILSKRLFYTISHKVSVMNCSELNKRGKYLYK